MDKDCGCHVCSVFFGCFIYADDIIPSLPSLIGLQAMLDVCACYGNTHDIIFNSKKSVCMAVGKSVIAPLPSMSIGDDNISWVKSLKYLGVTFVDGNHFKVDTLALKRKFYVDVLSKLSDASEPVLLHLLHTKCLPILLYSLGAMQLSSKKCQRFVNG